VNILKKVDACMKRRHTKWLEPKVKENVIEKTTK